MGMANLIGRIGTLIAPILAGLPFEVFLLMLGVCNGLAAFASVVMQPQPNTD